MRVLVTGSAGHLGEGLMRRLPELGCSVRGLDRKPGAFVDVVGSVADPAVVREAIDGVDGVVHAATLHKPHVGTHTKAEFVETNVAGTLTLLEAAVDAGVASFVFTSTTSAFGRSLVDETGARATWIDETVRSRPKNIYGATKVAAEDLCDLVHHEHRLPVVVLRTSRFFPEPDGLPGRAAAFDDANLKVLELLHRRADLDDLVTAHAAALRRAPDVGFGRFIATATTPFTRDDAAELATDAAAVIARRCGPATADVFAAQQWRFPSSIDRVYDNTAAREALDWSPTFTFDRAVDLLAAGQSPFSPLAATIGAKGYHDHHVETYSPADPGS